MKTHEISILRLRAYRDAADIAGWNLHVSMIDESIKATSPEKLLQEKVDVPENFILGAHKDVCQQWKSIIEKDFPDAFPEDEYFDFSRMHILDTDAYRVKERPIVIGDGWCHANKERKFTSIFIDKNYWEMETSEVCYNDRDMIKLRFKKKKNG
jgi:hypothetical protein